MLTVMMLDDDYLEWTMQKKQLTQFTPVSDEFMVCLFVTHS